MMDDFDLEQEELNDMDYRSNDKGPWKKIFKTVLRQRKIFINTYSNIITHI